jgi:hypothetical protein
MDNTGFGCDQEAMVIVECGNLYMYTLHPVCSIISKTIRFSEKVYWTWSVWFSFLYRFCFKLFPSDKYLLSYVRDTCRSAHKVVIEIVWSKWIFKSLNISS